MPAQFNRDQVISELWRSPDVAAAIAKMEPVALQDELKQELFLVLCEMDEAKLQALSERKELRWYMVGVMRNMVMSDRSTFYNTHRKFSEQILSTSYVSSDGYVVNLTREGDGLTSDAAKAENFESWSREQPEELVHNDVYEPADPLPDSLKPFGLTDDGLEWAASLTEAWEKFPHDSPEIHGLYNEMGLHPYEANMLRLYTEMGKNCQPVAKATGIQVRSVRYVVAAAKAKLQKQLIACS